MSDAPGIDFIGDIHGHATELDTLLFSMNYRQKGGSWRHPNRTAFFTGDLIFKGPNIPKAVETVRRMTLDGAANAVCGNHEFNDRAYHLEDPRHKNEPLLSHGGKHKEHQDNIARQYGSDGQLLQTHRDFLNALPVFYETDEIRVTHAMWDVRNIAVLKKAMPDGVPKKDHIVQAVTGATELGKALHDTLFGADVMLADLSAHGVRWSGRGKPARRVRWWRDGGTKTGYHTVRLEEAIMNAGEVANSVVPAYAIPKIAPDDDSRPVFFGHYSLADTPCVTHPKYQCVDFGVTRGEGCLAAYRWNAGDAGLQPDRIVTVKPVVQFARPQMLWSVY